MAKALKAKKETKKRVVKKVKKPQNIVFSAEEHTHNDFPDNVVFQKFKGVKEYTKPLWMTGGNKEQQRIKYNSYDGWMVKKGRSLYLVEKIVFFTSRGEKYVVYGSDIPYSYHSFQFNDHKIKLQKERNFKADFPHIVSRGKLSYQKHPHCTLYIPYRYLQELGYKIITEKEYNNDTHVTTTKKILKSEYLKRTLETVKTEDIEKQKKDILKLLEKAESKRDIATAFDKHSTVHIPVEYLRYEEYAKKEPY